jgi:hypothetical protein
MASRRQVKRENDGFCADDDAIVPLVVSKKLSSFKDDEDLEVAAAAVAPAATARDARISPEQWHTPALRELNSEAFCSYDPEKGRALSRQAARRIQERKMGDLRKTFLLCPATAEAGRYYGMGSKPHEQPLPAAHIAFLAFFVVSFILHPLWSLACVGVMVTTILAWVRLRGNPEASTNKVPDYMQDHGALMTPEKLQYIVNNRRPEEEPILSRSTFHVEQRSQR